MHYTSAFLFAFGANIDSLVIGLTYGIKKVKITWKSNVFIACITSLGTLISMNFGYFISMYIPKYWTNIMGCMILTTMGISMIYEYIQNSFYQKGNVMTLEDYDKDLSGVIEIKEAMMLAFGLTLNNIGLGIGASITGVSIILSSSFTFILSVAFIQLSQYLGKSYLSKYLHNNAMLISGIMIFILGIFELFL